MVLGTNSMFHGGAGEKCGYLMPLARVRSIAGPQSSLYHPTPRMVSLGMGDPQFQMMSSFESPFPVEGVMGGLVHPGVPTTVSIIPYCKATVSGEEATMSGEEVAT